MQVTSTSEAATSEEAPSIWSNVEAQGEGSDGQHFKDGSGNKVSQHKGTIDLIFKNGDVDLRAEFTPDGKFKCFFCSDEVKQVKRHLNSKHELQIQDQAALEKFCQ